MSSNRLYIIGCGGVGSWAAPAACLLVSPGNVTVVDGDVLEEKNLNRQLFTPKHIGMNKATALAGVYRCDPVSDYYSVGMIEHDPSDALICCVDNNRSRRDVLEACDSCQCRGDPGSERGAFQ